MGTWPWDKKNPAGLYSGLLLALSHCITRLQKKSCRTRRFNTVLRNVVESWALKHFSFFLLLCINLLKVLCTYPWVLTTLSLLFLCLLGRHLLYSEDIWVERATSLVCIPDLALRTLSFVRLCSLDTANCTNGDKGVHSLLKGICGAVHKKSDRRGSIKNQGGERSADITLLRTAGQCIWLLISVIWRDTNILIP